MFKVFTISDFQNQEVSLPEVTWGKRKVRLTLELEIIVVNKGGEKEFSIEFCIKPEKHKDTNYNTVTFR